MVVTIECLKVLIITVYVSVVRKLLGTVQSRGNVTCLVRSSLRVSEDPMRQICKMETHRTKKLVIVRQASLQGFLLPEHQETYCNCATISI